MPGALGGGQQSGGTVVQSTNPFAAIMAGRVGSVAAQAANQAATNDINTAINQMNQAYSGAVQTLQPYTQTGVQALDQLNQYLGLKAYNPGTAPNAPVAPTIQGELGKITPEQIANYVYNNSAVAGGTGDTRVGGLALNYSGAGTYNNVPEFKALNDQGTIGAGKYGPGYYGSEQAIAQNLKDPITQALAKQQMTADMASYNQQLPIYQQQMDAYNYAKGLQTQYDAAGPLTADQISQQISSQPGFQAQLQQGTQAIQNSAASKGYLGSGNILQALSDYGQNQLSTYYGNTLSRLSNLASAGQQASTSTAGVSSNQGNSLAGLYSGLATDQANSLLAGAKSQADAITAANQQFQVMGQSSGGSGLGSLLGGVGSVLGLGTGGGGTIGGSIFNALSTKTMKDKVSTPSTKEILANVDKLSLDKWKYKGVEEEHLGPYAEEFKELFGVGDGKTINLIDVVGVLLGSVKELSKKVEELQNASRL